MAGIRKELHSTSENSRVTIESEPVRSDLMDSSEGTTENCTIESGVGYSVPRKMIKLPEGAKPVSVSAETMECASRRVSKVPEKATSVNAIITETRIPQRATSDMRIHRLINTLEKLFIEEKKATETFDETIVKHMEVDYVASRQLLPEEPLRSTASVFRDTLKLAKGPLVTKAITAKVKMDIAMEEMFQTVGRLLVIKDVSNTVKIPRGNLGNVVVTRDTKLDEEALETLMRLASRKEVPFALKNPGGAVRGDLGNNVARGGIKLDDYRKAKIFRELGAIKKICDARTATELLFHELSNVPAGVAAQTNVSATKSAIDTAFHQLLAEQLDSANREVFSIKQEMDTSDKVQIRAGSVSRETNQRTPRLDSLPHEVLLRLCQLSETSSVYNSYRRVPGRLQNVAYDNGAGLRELCLEGTQNDIHSLQKFRFSLRKVYCQQLRREYSFEMFLLLEQCENLEALYMPWVVNCDSMIESFYELLLARARKLKTLHLNLVDCADPVSRKKCMLRLLPKFRDLLYGKLSVVFNQGCFADFDVPYGVKQLEIRSYLAEPIDDSDIQKAIRDNRDTLKKLKLWGTNLDSGILSEILKCGNLKEISVGGYIYWEGLVKMHSQDGLSLDDFKLTLNATKKGMHPFVNGKIYELRLPKVTNLKLVHWGHPLDVLEIGPDGYHKLSEVFPNLKKLHLQGEYEYLFSENMERAWHLFSVFPHLEFVKLSECSMFEVSFDRLRLLKYMRPPGKLQKLTVMSKVALEEEQMNELLEYNVTCKKGMLRKKRTEDCEFGFTLTVTRRNNHPLQ